VIVTEAVFARAETQVYITLSAFYTRNAGAKRNSAAHSFSRKLGPMSGFISTHVTCGNRLNTMPRSFNFELRLNTWSASFSSLATGCESLVDFAQTYTHILYIIYSVFNKSKCDNACHW